MQPLNSTSNKSTSNKSTSNKLLLAVAGLSPLVLLAPAAQARIPQDATQLKQASANSPFIDAGARYNTLENMKNAPIFRPGDILQVEDGGGTGKEASDKGKDASDKGKDACDKCDSSRPSGNVIRPDIDLVNPGSPTPGPVIQMERPAELLRSPKVIF
ncbi:MAG: hypothetical protein AB8B99_10325 [Phormidesmis sp.]